MGVTTTQTNKPLNPRGNDQSPLAYNRAKLFSGKALDFDGVNDSIEINSFSMSGQNVSFAFYLKADNWVASDLIFDFKTRRLALGCQNTNVLSLYSNNAWHDFGTISDTTNRNFITITIEGTTAKAYINAQPFGTIGTIATIDLTSPAEARLMGRYSDTAQYFDGEIAGFKIFNTALTPAQVADLYNNPEKVVPTGVDNTALKLWLPMQEGAGTTAYDGSGNGNHGTISGATYTHGIGAPVSQTAVIDWNKGVNYAVYSEDFSQSDWIKTSLTLDADETTAPDGQTTADEIHFTASSGSKIEDVLAGVYNNQTHSVSVWAKVASGTEKFRLKCTHAGVTDYFSSTLTATTEWQRFTFSQAFGATSGSGIVYGMINDTDAQARDIFFWGFQLETNTSSAGPYVRTGSTAQTSEVLLPQGLTTGRDITGVNLFENVRKQGALNLDGNSWAEVHDNASLAISNTDDVTMEIWFNRLAEPKNVYPKWIDAGVGNDDETNYSFGSILKTDEVFVEWRTSSSGWIFTDTDVTFNKNEWTHLVVTIEMTGANSSIKTYKNGVLSSTKSKTTTRGTGGKTIIGKHRVNEYYGYDILAQPRIYNRALTAEEVQRNYNAGKNTYTN